MDPYSIIADKCVCVDQQVMKLQELPDNVRVGEIPCHVVLTADRYLASKVVPGSRINITGIFSIFQRAAGKGKGGKPESAGVCTPYIRVMGIEEEEAAGRNKREFTEDEEREFRELASDPDIYTKFVNSIAPGIYGFSGASSRSQLNG